MQSRVILGINPGARYLGYALLQRSDLRDWGIKAVKGKWTPEKKKKIERIFQDFLDEFKPDYIAIKKLHPARSSAELDTQISKLKELCHIHKIPVYEYSIEYLEKMILSERLNKKNLVETLFEQYPVLFSEIEKERVIFSKIEKKRSSKKIYHTRMFEAVALAHVCFNQLDNH